MSAKANQTAKRTRIQKANEKKIMDAALQAFGTYGYRGTTIEQIAGLAQMSKPNLLYYFGDKQGLYTAVLSRTLETWLDPLAQIDPNGDPLDEIWRYARKKLQMARAQPAESRLFAVEILQCAPVIQTVLKTRLKDLVDDRVRLFRRWIDAGRLADIDPHHLLYLIWAATQTYADFWTQIEILSDDSGDKDALFSTAENTLRRILMNGLKP